VAAAPLPQTGSHWLGGSIRKLWRGTQNQRIAAMFDAAIARGDTYYRPGAIQACHGGKRAYSLTEYWRRDV
jgi:hypothetical protein